jgi:hypothetical protein
VLPTFVSHRSSAFLWVIRLIDLEAQLTVVLCAGSLVSCHSFLASAYALTPDLDQRDCCWCLQVYSYLPTAYALNNRDSKVTRHSFGF